MSTYVMLTTLTPEAVKSPGELKGLERKVVDKIPKELPQVKWTSSYAILGGVRTRAARCDHGRRNRRDVPASRRKDSLGLI